MRSNGLVASAYTPIADLDPRVASSLLDDLAALGVAAYTKPVEPSTSVGFERSDFRISVRDRLYVDVAASAQVRALVAAQDQDLVYQSDDLAWARLVADFDLPLESPVAPWPTQEDIDVPPLAPGASSADDDTTSHEGFPFTDRRRQGNGWTNVGRPLPLPSPEPDSLADPPAPASPRRRRSDQDLSAQQPRMTDDEDLFVPDPPPPLPKVAAHKQLAWVGLIGGPALLLLAALLQLTLPGWVTVPAVAGFIGGFITLVATMEDRNDGDWSSGNGAVV